MSGDFGGYFNASFRNVRSYLQNSVQLLVLPPSPRPEPECVRPVPCGRL